MRPRRSICGRAAAIEVMNQAMAENHANLDDMLQLLRHHLPDLEKRYGVESLWLFGSYVRGVEREGSDLDVLVEVNRNMGLFEFVALEEHLGEAAKHVPNEVRARFPEVPFPDISRMRDKVIHVYFGVDLQIVWDTITTDIPHALPAVQTALQVLEVEEESR